MGTGQVRLLSIIVGVNAVVSLVAIAALASWFGLPGAAYGNLVACLGIAVNRAVIEQTLFGRVDVVRVLLPVVSGLAVVAGTLALIRREVSPLSLGPAGTALAAFGLALACAAALALLMRGRRAVPQAAASDAASVEEAGESPA
jgi:O-antigen/teichoic acid export membrane protein